LLAARAAAAGTLLSFFSLSLPFPLSRFLFRFARTRRLELTSLEEKTEDKRVRTTWRHFLRQQNARYNSLATCCPHISSNWDCLDRLIGEAWSVVPVLLPALMDPERPVRRIRPDFRSHRVKARFPNVHSELKQNVRIDAARNDAKNREKCTWMISLRFRSGFVTQGEGKERIKFYVFRKIRNSNLIATRDVPSKLARTRRFAFEACCPRSQRSRRLITE
jgi:hypothetical protein